MMRQWCEILWCFLAGWDHGSFPRFLINIKHNPSRTVILRPGIFWNCYRLTINKSACAWNLHFCMECAPESVWVGRDLWQRPTTQNPSYGTKSTSFLQVSVMKLRSATSVLAIPSQIRKTIFRLWLGEVYSVVTASTPVECRESVAVLKNCPFLSLFSSFLQLHGNQHCDSWKYVARVDVFDKNFLSTVNVRNTLFFIDLSLRYLMKKTGGRRWCDLPKSSSETTTASYFSLHPLLASSLYILVYYYEKQC